MGLAPGGPQPQYKQTTGLSTELPSRAPEPLLTRRRGEGGLCEAAPGVGSRFRCPAYQGEGQAEAGIRDPVEDGSHHAGGSAPQGRAEPLCPVPCPGSRASPPPAAEVTPGGPGPAAWKWGCSVGQPLCGVGVPHPQMLLPVLGGGGCPLASAEHTPTSPTGLSDPFLRSFRPPWNSRSRFPAWWTVGSPLPLPTPLPDGGAVPWERAPHQPRGLLTLYSLCLGKTSGEHRHSLPLTPSSLSLDYGVQPKHPWPRGPRPLLSRAQQRKRDGPDMAEYYYDSRL